MRENWYEMIEREASIIRKMIEREASIIRKMNDAAAFEYIVGLYPPGDAANCGMAFHLIRRRPWRKAFHIPLVEPYLKDAQGDGFRIAITSCMKFMRADTFSHLLWNVTEGDDKKRHFARYYFHGEIARTHGSDHSSLKRWQKGADP